MCVGLSEVVGVIEKWHGNTALPAREPLAGELFSIVIFQAWSGNTRVSLMNERQKERNRRKRKRKSILKKRGREIDKEEREKGKV